MNHRKEPDATQSILEKVLFKARELNVKHIASVHIAIGEITELNRDSIQSHWNELSKNTTAEGSQIRFHIVIAEVQCMACFQKYHPQGGEIHCPNCGSYGAKIVSGEEFYLESIETD